MVGTLGKIMIGMGLGMILTTVIDIPNGHGLVVVAGGLLMMGPVILEEMRDTFEATEQKL